MIFHRLASGLIAGAIAGLLAALLHFSFVQEYILLSESYETGTVTHFPDGHVGHDAPQTQSDNSQTDTTGADSQLKPLQHVHGFFDAGSFLTRDVGTVLFTVLTYAAYGLILVTAFGLAELIGAKIRPEQGVLWGMAGFAALQMAPAMGVAPQLPGTIAADLLERQTWWLLTALATALSLALVAFGRTKAMAGLGLVVVALPHIYGAPTIEGFWGAAPPEVAGTFSARVLGVGLASWVVLGWLCTKEWAKGAK